MQVHSCDVDGSTRLLAMQCSRHHMTHKATGMLSALTVIAYSEPLSVLSRRARNSSRSITPFLQHSQVGAKVLWRTEARHLLHIPIRIPESLCTAPHRAAPSFLSALLWHPVGSMEGARCQGKGVHTYPSMSAALKRACRAS